MAEVAWPPVPEARGATLLAMLRQFEATEWWSPDRLADHQFHQVGRLAEHAFRTVPFYRARLEEAGYIALQAPAGTAGDSYLVQSEAALVEIVDATGAPCRTGAGKFEDFVSKILPGAPAPTASPAGSGG